ncbi:Lcl C-terminal domain-containing protein [Delftia acidovorans]|uniref:Lcl C-terminal domain-containing protein n=2 Tax=Delftia acidovorans TaxID=80866 RepID=UPI0035A054E9
MRPSLPSLPPALNALPGPLLAALLLGVCTLGSAQAAQRETQQETQQETQRGPRPGAAPVLEVSEDGRDVIDRRARLLWPRCVEGMHWNGKTCTGLPELFTHKQAQALAAERAKQEGVRWRLPRVNEMRRLISRDIRPQGLSPELFPGAPRGWHWTGTAAVNARPVNPYNYSNISGSAGTQLSAQQAWAIDLDSLETRPDMGRGNQLMVRLVRPLPSAPPDEKAEAPARPAPHRPDPDEED